MNEEDSEPSEDEEIEYSRAFVQKVRNFIKYYPLKRREPLQLIRQSLSNLKKTVNKTDDLNGLEPLCKEISESEGYKEPSELFQFEVVEESNRYIVYRPNKLLDKERDNISVIDLIYVKR